MSGRSDGRTARAKTAAPPRNGRENERYAWKTDVPEARIRTHDRSPPDLSRPICLSVRVHARRSRSFRFAIRFSPRASCPSYHVSISRRPRSIPRRRPARSIPRFLRTRDFPLYLAVCVPSDRVKRHITIDGRNTLYWRDEQHRSPSPYMYTHTCPRSL